MQTVRFEEHRPITVRIASSTGWRGLVFGHGQGGIAIPARSLISRTDNTTGFYASGTCSPIPPKDCGTKALKGFDPYIFAEKGGRLSLQGDYWDSAPPFQNCIALQTPVPLLDRPFIYNGWVFGESLLSNPNGSTLTTARVSPRSLRIGRTYHFHARKVFRLRDSDLHRNFAIDSNGGLGGPNVPQDASPGDMLGGDRSIVDTVSWEIVLKRLS